MLTSALKEGLIDPSHSIQVGIRTHNKKTRGLTIIYAPWVHENGTKAATKKILEIVGSHKAYLTFDIDYLDPAFTPVTGTSVAGGLSSAQALGILRGLGQLNFIDADVSR